MRIICVDTPFFFYRCVGSWHFVRFEVRSRKSINFMMTFSHNFDSRHPHQVFEARLIPSPQVILMSSKSLIFTMSLALTKLIEISALFLQNDAIDRESPMFRDQIMYFPTFASFNSKRPLSRAKSNTQFQLFESTGASLTRNLSLSKKHNIHGCVCVKFHSSRTIVRSILAASLPFETHHDKASSAAISVFDDLEEDYLDGT